MAKKFTPEYVLDAVAVDSSEKTKEVEDMYQSMSENQLVQEINDLMDEEVLTGEESLIDFFVKALSIAQRALTMEEESETTLKELNRIMGKSIRVLIALRVLGKKIQSRS